MQEKQAQPRCIDVPCLALCAGTAAAVPLLAQTLAAHHRAGAALAAQQAEALAALGALARELTRQAGESSAEARQLAQQPDSLELVSWLGCRSRGRRDEQAHASC